MIDSYFSTNDHQIIQEAVRAAEKRASGEIVPCVVTASDRYPEATWKAGSLGAMGTAVIFITLFLTEWSWGGDILWFCLIAAVGASFGVTLELSCPWFRRVIIGPARLARRVEERAHTAFLKEEVFSTTHRNGILIFISLFERRVTILADSGIHKKVTTDDWSAIANGIAKGIGATHAGEALAQGISQCADLLIKHGFVRTSQGPDELSDELRTEEGTS